VELDQIAQNPENYQGKNVTTIGFLEPLHGFKYWSLSDRIARVLLIPGEGTQGGELEAFQGRRVEVTGVVRRLKTCVGEPPCRLGHCSICDDPELPPLPDPRLEWPYASITILSLSDTGETGKGRDGGRSDTADESLEDILGDLPAAAGRRVRITGQFRGRNLFGDLPPSSQRDASDWVLKDGEHAVWVTGKKPQGKGWRLDPASTSDARWKLEVEGVVEVAGGVVYVRAKRVDLKKAAP
jgi:hypothetical protein